MSSSRTEYESIVPQLRLRRATTSVPSNEAVFELAPGDEVLVEREKQGRNEPYMFFTATKDSQWY